MDFNCPTQTKTLGQAIKVYLLEPDIPEEDQMVELDEETYSILKQL